MHATMHTQSDSAGAWPQLDQAACRAVKSACEEQVETNTLTQL